MIFQINQGKPRTTHVDFVKKTRWDPPCLTGRDGSVPPDFRGEESRGRTGSKGAAVKRLVRLKGLEGSVLAFQN